MYGQQDYNPPVITLNAGVKAPEGFAIKGIDGVAGWTSSPQQIYGASKNGAQFNQGYAQTFTFSVTDADKTLQKAFAGQKDKEQQIEVVAASYHVDAKGYVVDAIATFTKAAVLSAAWEGGQTTVTFAGVAKSDSMISLKVGDEASPTISVLTGKPDNK
jgi:hypothetical protein